VFLLELMCFFGIECIFVYLGVGFFDIDCFLAAVLGKCVFVRN